MHHYHAGHTLVSQKAFVWCRHTDGSITVRDEPAGAVRVRMNARQYSEVLDLLTSRAEGICLGAVKAGEQVPDYLGWLLSSYGMSRSAASWIVAVAAEEGFVETEHRGNGASGLWLMPAVEGSNRSDRARGIPVKTGDTRGQPYTIETAEKNGMNIDPCGAAADLRALADQIEQTRAIDGFDGELCLENLQDEEETTRLISEITAWEREVPNARYLYSFTVPDTALSLRCRDALARARSRNVDNRRFSKLNGDLEESCCLYVGSSRSLSSRIRQHLGLAHRGTYAMQMAHWQPEERLEGRVRFSATRFASDTGASILQALEDKLWLTERPLFGRMGAR